MSKSTDPSKFKWATAERVIGYTASRPIDVSKFERWRKAATAKGTLDLGILYQEARNSFRGFLPSVYYRGGHATLDHKAWGNIGWEGSGRSWLFFQNVPKRIDFKSAHYDTESDKRRLEGVVDAHRKANPNAFFPKETPLDNIWKQNTTKHKNKVARVFIAKMFLETYGTYLWLDFWHHMPMIVPYGQEWVKNVSSHWRLVEIFEEKSYLDYHPSRNPFHGVQSPEIGNTLHSLAISPAMRMSRLRLNPNRNPDT